MVIGVSLADAFGHFEIINGVSHAGAGSLYAPWAKQATSSLSGKQARVVQQSKHLQVQVHLSVCLFTALSRDYSLDALLGGWSCADAGARRPPQIDPRRPRRIDPKRPRPTDPKRPATVAPATPERNQP
jgi:hypothetical protein